MSIRESALLARNVAYNLFAGPYLQAPAQAYAGAIRTHVTRRARPAVKTRLHRTRGFAGSSCCSSCFDGGPCGGGGK